MPPREPRVHYGVETALNVFFGEPGQQVVRYYPACGAGLGEFTEVTQSPDEVTCKRCLRWRLA